MCIDFIRKKIYAYRKLESYRCGLYSFPKNVKNERLQFVIRDIE